MIGVSLLKRLADACEILAYHPPCRELSAISLAAHAPGHKGPLTDELHTITCSSHKEQGPGRISPPPQAALRTDTLNLASTMLPVTTLPHYTDDTRERRVITPNRPEALCPIHPNLASTSFLCLPGVPLYNSTAKVEDASPLKSVAPFQIG